MIDTPAPPEAADRDTPITPRLVASLIGAAGDHDAPLLRRIVAPLHPADTAALLAQAPEETARTVFRLIGPELPAELLAELDDDLRELALEILPNTQIAAAVADLDTDDAAAVLAELDEGDLADVLAQAPDDVRRAIETALAFEEDTAGRLMQREFVAAPEHWDVGRVIDHMREVGDDLPDLFFEIYLIDPGFRPVGGIAVSRMMRAARSTPLSALAEPLRLLVRPEMDQEEVALSFQRYHLISAPVVDEAGRLTGMITVDDMVQVIQDENKEDLLALAGVSDASTADSVWSSVQARLPWLGVNLLTALSASALIALFQPTLEKIVALAILMPIVASMGGNAGTQALAVAVRAIAARELTASNALRIIGREVMTGAFNGLVVALVLALVAGVWFGQPLIALTIGIAVVLNLTAAGLAGILVPLTLRRLGQDPAVSSSVFVTFTTDLIGFCAFLGLATMILL